MTAHRHWIPARGTIAVGSADLVALAAAFAVEPDYDGLESVARRVQKGKLSVHVGRTFPLEEAGHARAVYEGDHPAWKIVLVLCLLARSCIFLVNSVRIISATSDAAFSSSMSISTNERSLANWGAAA